MKEVKFITEDEQKILRFIKSNPYSKSNEIERKFLIGGNKIRDIVRSLRRKGYMVGSVREGNKYGYFLAKNEKDFSETVNNIKKRIKSLQNTLLLLHEKNNGKVRIK